ncbi:hypothetical protein N9877_04755 [Flavobacteriaceae bacterium]|nr:hypothetical protein [Flavobacteriaceae bacterium]
MKKSLLSILASALLVVGCQNYDDQFTNLESQISALVQTVAGLSQVQSELAQLTTNVSNIQSALADIPSSAEINTSINEGLAGVVADIADLETSLDNVVSADDLTTVSDAISDVADDVNDILSSNNVYDQKLLITNQAELDIAIGLGGKIALINNDVEIVLDDEMNRADLDSIAARITAVVGGFEYDGDLEDFESNGLVFSKLKSVSQQLKWETRDDISFPALTSVGSLDIVTGDSELITSASFPVLTKLPYVSTSTDGGTTTQASTIDLEDSASLTMSALIRYTGVATAAQRGTKAAAGVATTASNALTIILDDDDATTFDLAALTTEDADDSDSDTALALTLTGPRSVTLANYAQGVLTAADATTVVLPDYEWNASTALASVETLRVHKVATSVDVSGFSNLEILDLQNAAYETKNPTAIAISVGGNTNVENINLNGYFASFTATGTTSLDTIVTAGEIGTFEITTSKIVELSLGHKAWRTLAGTPVATLQLTGNTKLTSVTADSLDDVNVMEIVDNDKLATISLAGLTSTSTKAAASATAGTPAVAPVIGVQIYGNAKLTSTYQTASAVGALTTVAEAVTLDQAPTSLVTWIKAAKAVWGVTGYGAVGTSSKADGTIYIATDEYTSVAADGDETEVSSAYVVANLYGAETSNAVAGLTAIRSLSIPNHASTTGTVIIGGVSKSITAGDVSNAVVGLSEFVTTNSSAYSAAGYSIASQGYGYSDNTLVVTATEAALTTVQYGDIFVFTFGGSSVTIPLTDNDADVAGVQFGGKTLGFDTTSGVVTTTAVTTPTATASAYVTTGTELMEALAWYLNQADKKFPNYLGTAASNTTSSTGDDDTDAALSGENYDLGKWTAVYTDAAGITVTFNQDKTNVLNGAIVLEHQDGALSSEITLTKDLSLLEYAGAVLTATADGGNGDAYNFTITGTIAASASGTALVKASIGNGGTVYLSGVTDATNSVVRSLTAENGTAYTNTDNTGDESLNDWTTAFYQYGIDDDANTAASAGSTPDKISKLAAGVTS